MKYLIVLICLTVSPLLSQNLEIQKEILLDVDRQLALSAETNGIGDALLQVMDESSILLPQNGHPIHGNEGFKMVLSRQVPPVEDRVPAWKPLFADLSRSGEYGYTVGKFPVSDPDTSVHSSKNNYYGSIWKRQGTGNWKIILQVGLLNIKVENAAPENKLSFTEEEQCIVNTDRAFSQLSKESGYLKAFHTYIAEDGVALSGGGRPPANKERYQQMIDYYKSHEQPFFQLTWEPLFSSMSNSGELGFTHGSYQSVSLDKNGKQVNGYGYYVSIWKEQADGSWRFVFDGGNESPVPRIISE